MKTKVINGFADIESDRPIFVGKEYNNKVVEIRYGNQHAAAAKGGILLGYKKWNVYPGIVSKYIYLKEEV